MNTKTGAYGAPYRLQAAFLGMLKLTFELVRFSGEEV